MMRICNILRGRLSLRMSDILFPHTPALETQAARALLLSASFLVLLGDRSWPSPSLRRFAVTQSLQRNLVSGILDWLSTCIDGPRHRAQRHWSKFWRVQLCMAWTFWKRREALATSNIVGCRIPLQSLQRTKKPATLCETCNAYVLKTQTDQAIEILYV